MTRRICILYTGGTIGMEQGERGWRPAPSFAALTDRLHPGLRNGAEVREYSPLLDSANAGPEVWYRLGRDIRALAADYDGFVVIYGTDTLCYVAASLSFQLAGTGIPVAVTGAMVPMVAEGSDGGTNLGLALKTVTAMADGPATQRGVSVCFNGRVIHGARARKLMAHDMDAMRDAAALLDGQPRPQTAVAAPGRASLPAVAETAPVPTVALLTLHPGIGLHADSLFAVPPQGLIVECFGSGTGPTADAGLVRLLHRLRDGGTAMVAVSQCLHGAIAFDTYEAGAAFADAGVIAGGHMTREAALTKLHLALSLGFGRDVLAEDWVGEM